MITRIKKRIIRTAHCNPYGFGITYGWVNMITDNNTANDYNTDRYYEPRQ